MRRLLPDGLDLGDVVLVGNRASSKSQLPGKVGDASLSGELRKGSSVLLVLDVKELKHLGSKISTRNTRMLRSARMAIEMWEPKKPERKQWEGSSGKFFQKKFHAETKATEWKMKCWQGAMCLMSGIDSVRTKWIRAKSKCNIKFEFARGRRVNEQHQTKSQNDPES
eukprot:257661-Hanusia_phi.AAC.3